MRLMGALFLIILTSGCYVSKNPMRKEVKRLQKGQVKDDSSYIYGLPYEEGKSHYLVQGYFSALTHRERAALDFNNKTPEEFISQHSVDRLDAFSLTFQQLDLSIFFVGNLRGTSLYLVQ